MNIHLILKLFVKIHIFEEDNVWRNIFGRVWIDFDPKMRPKCDQKSDKKMIGFLIGFWSSQEATAPIGPSGRGLHVGGSTPP